MNYFNEYFGFRVDPFIPRHNAELAEAVRAHAEFAEQQLNAIANEQPPYGDPATWVTNFIDDMSFLFKDMGEIVHVFDVSGWDVSNVRHMNGMFENCSHFNQPLHWNTSRVESMAKMFKGCTQFNQPLEGRTSDGHVAWNVSSVRNMAQMFFGCETFDQSLGMWDVSRVENFNRMFRRCRAFTQVQSLDTWRLGNATTVDMFDSTAVSTPIWYHQPRPLPTAAYETLNRGNINRGNRGNINRGDSNRN